MKQLSWTQFDQAVAVLAERFATGSFAGIYGVPRGGLCLAVALSHSLQKPLLLAWVSDVILFCGPTMIQLH